MMFIFRKIMEYKMCPIFFGIMFLVTLLYILQGVFNSYFIAGDCR